MLLKKKVDAFQPLPNLSVFVVKQSQIERYWKSKKKKNHQKTKKQNKKEMVVV